MRPFVVTLLFLMTLAPARGWSEPTMDAIEVWLDSWQLDRAQLAIERAAKRSVADPQVVYFEARYAFLRGRYDEALERMDQALTLSPRPDWQSLRALIAATHDVTKDYERHVSPSGRFEIAIEPGADRVLLTYAFDALDRAYDVLAGTLGHRPLPPIRIEVYPRTSVLAQVSLLTEEEIRASGTIALCKYNRLMITSPRALLRGYPWVDTLVHEFVHYVVNQRTSNRVPIWMHEGLAKFLERSWRESGQAALSDPSRALLKKRLDADELITFEQMHPSMAKLPTQEDAALAFAEVFMAMEYLSEKAGDKAFAELLGHIVDGAPADRAFAAVLGSSFEDFETLWVDWMKRKLAGVKTSVGDHDERLVFRDERERPTLLEQIPEPQARDHLHLGELLQARGRYKAAVVQYRKAEALLADVHPVLVSRLARTLVESGAFVEAIAALEPALEIFSGDVVLWVLLGRAYLGANRFEEARKCLMEAIWINPFDPEVHTALSLVHRGLGDAGMAERSRGLAKEARGFGQR
jgi:tetratricopeptide (TPR) repeat protein